MATPYKTGQTRWSNEKRLLRRNNYTADNLQLFIDTTVKTTSTVAYTNEYNETPGSIKSFQSYLLILRNISDSPLYLGRTFELYYLTRQVKNKHGQWVSLDHPLSETTLCLTGQPTITLQPKEIVISKCKRYSGSFFTAFRFAFGTKDHMVYSNVFKDFIDERIIQNSYQVDDTFLQDITLLKKSNTYYQ